MPEPISERDRLVTATAQRLRLVQIDFADEKAEVRDEYLADEVQRALAKIVPDERPAFLEELQGHFPAWDQRVERLSSDGPAPATAFDLRELEDPAFLVTRLAELAPKLSELERQAVVDRLKTVGLVTEGRAQWPDEPAQAARAKLQMEPADNIDAAHALELIAFLADFATSLDQLVWSTWKQIAPKTMVRRQAPLQKAMGRFLKNDLDVPRGQITGDLERLRQLTASLISAVSQIGRQFAHRHLAKLSPTEIENWARMEKGGILTSNEAKCWRKYVELTRSLDEASIEAEIFQSIAEYTESLIKGVSR